MGLTEFSSTGGARVGWINATWPFAKLTVSHDRIELNASLIGRYSFSSDQVVAIKEYSTIPLFGWGIQIHHNIAAYPKRIIFWCMGSPKNLIKKISQTGFVASASPDSVPPDRGLPVRWQAILGAIILWNLLFIMDMFNPQLEQGELGWFSLLAIVLLFMGSIAIWGDNWLQRMFMKPGRQPGEIQAWLFLLAFISGMMSLIFFIQLLFK